ncbi:MAG: fluoride efflux transporter CrcB [Firmicutes bacterium]|nr:fluoride efflux transporter CrcB [Bacillota bacterium]
MKLFLLIGLAGATGALSRYALQGLVAERALSAFPYGTFAINIVGSFLLGFFATAGFQRFMVNPEYRTALTVGFLGAFTTFSSWSYETLQLFGGGSFTLAAVNAFGSMLAGLIAVWLGSLVGRVL